MTEDKEKKKPIMMDGGYNPNRIIDLTDGKGDVTRATHYPDSRTTVINERKTKK